MRRNKSLWNGIIRLVGNSPNNIVEVSHTDFPDTNPDQFLEHLCMMRDEGLIHDTLVFGGTQHLRLTGAGNDYLDSLPSDRAWQRIGTWLVKYWWQGVLAGIGVLATAFWRRLADLAMDLLPSF